MGILQPITLSSTHPFRIGRLCGNYRAFNVFATFTALWKSRIRTTVPVYRPPCEDDVLQLLRTHHFETVQIALRSDEEDLKEFDLRVSLSSDQKGPDKERRFTPNFMKELLEDYQLSKRTAEMAIFCPN